MENLINVFVISFQLVSFIFTDFDFFISQTSLQLSEKIIFHYLLIFIIIYSFIKRNKIRLLKKDINLLSAGVIVLLFLFLFPAVITSESPDFQKNLAVTKLLPPFSIKEIIKLKNDNSSNTAGSFLDIKNVLIKSSFDDNILIADSTTGSTDTLTCFQKDKKIQLSKNRIEETKSFLYLLGTDELGRDVFTRLIYGTRVSMFIGIVSVLLSLIIAGITGFWAGYSEGKVDMLLNRLAEMFLAFPMIFIIIFVAALWGNSLITLFLLLGFSGWMSLFKIIRTEIKSVKNKDYFITSMQIGLSKYRIAIKEILPVILTPVIVNLFFQFGNVIIAESALSFLGLGSGINYPSWGAMIKEGQEYIYSGWWLIFLPGFSLICTLLLINRLSLKINSIINPQLAND